MSTYSQTFKNGFFAFAISLLFIANSQAQATIQPPDELIKDNTIKMLRSINEHRPEIKKTPEKLTALVEEIILPHLDFITASKMVMGKYWRRAEKEQKIKFIREFRLLLLRFYSSALSEYLNGKDNDLKLDLIKYFPVTLKEGETALTVRGEVEQQNGPAIPIHYRMHLTSKGWKIFDVSVEGISMITTYKNNFATQFQTDGIDALIVSLEEKNKDMLATNTSKTN
ncbi:MAG: ABC transporter substrate-binding protein [Gammaproteobacteria bacterium]|nr:ABC transporter substrate-binding protein [Gammaproteobacteria bacterium]MCW8987144.1 ABC transporter substrate-binding protein [Gammaproteobacteria bacterium]